jgi:hypothetical protein
MARDIRLMKRPRMDNRFDPMVRKGALDHHSFGHSRGPILSVCLHAFSVNS